MVGCRHLSDGRNQLTHAVSVTEKLNGSLTMVEIFAHAQTRGYYKHWTRYPRTWDLRTGDPRTRGPEDRGPKDPDS